MKIHKYINYLKLLNCCFLIVSSYQFKEIFKDKLRTFIRNNNKTFVHY